MSAPTLSVGMIGTGSMARTMALALMTAPGARLRVVASAHDPVRAREFCDSLVDEVAPCVSVPALLACDDLDLIYVASASADHANHAIAALEAGHHTLIEKPLALNASDANRVAAAAHEVGRFCMEAMWTPFLPAWRVAERQVHDWDNARHLQFAFGTVIDPSLAPRLFAPGPAAGVLLDRGIYGVTLALRCFGAVRDVAAHIRTTERGVGIEADLQLRHAGGGVSQIAVSQVSLLANRAEIAGPNGLIMIAPPLLGAEAVTIQPATPGGVGGEGTGLKARLKQSPALRHLRSSLSGPKFARHPWGANMYHPLWAHIAEEIGAGQLESRTHPLSASIAALDVLDRAQKASTIP